MQLSIVTTLYNSSKYINEFYRRCKNVANRMQISDYEIIFVNDGSPDNSLDIAVDLNKKDGRVIVIDLSRNFGHHKSMMTGIGAAQGDLVFLLDSDLEEQPEWLEKFSSILHSEDSDVVYGVQESRKGGVFEKISGSISYALYNFLTEINHPRNITTARLMTRRYVDALVCFREQDLVISCLWVLTGFKQCECIVKKISLNPTNYSLQMKVSLFFNTIVSFSSAPLKLIFLTGATLTLAAFFYTSSLILNFFIHNRVVDGWTSLMVSVWLIGGIIISFLGIMSLYLSKIFIEIKQRPYSIIRKIYGR